jgi:hypothetical protein
MSSTECNLLGLSEVFVDILVELQFSNISHRQDLLRPNFSGIKDIEVELILTRFRTDLYTELPGWEDSTVNSAIKILAMEISVLTSDRQCFILDQRMDSQWECEVKLDKVTDTFCVRQSIRVNTKTLHHAVGSRNTTIAHGPHEHMCGFGVEILEIPEVVVGRLSLGDLSI